MVALTPEADHLKSGKYDTLVHFKNITNGNEASRHAILSSKEKWRLSLIQRNDLFFGSGLIAGGVIASVRTDMDIVIENGQYKRGVAKAYFTSIKKLSLPPGVFDCIPNSQNGTWIKNRSYPVSGRVIGDSVQLEISPRYSSPIVGANHHCPSKTRASNGEG